MSDEVFENDEEFDRLAVILNKGLLASYLLGFDQPKVVSFADPFTVTPDAAIEHFEKKRVVPRAQFERLRGEARDAAFTVAGVYREDVLSGFKSEVTKALQQGIPREKTVKRFREILAGAGHQSLGDFHLETVFRVNMQRSFGVGRRHSLEGASEDLPFWEYHTAGDDRVRPTHAALNGMILPANHEFWNSHFAPWDFNCRCTVSATDSIPDDYNHNNPSGEAEIYYDEAGLPSKAEIGTAVYDLQAGDFRGIPPGKNLRDVIDDGVKRSRGKSEKKPSESTALGVPVSQALDAQWPARFQSRVDRIMRAIDTVHGDGDLPRIPFVRERLTGEFATARGLYVWTQDGESVRISINTNAPDVELTSIHEIGHFLDQKGIGLGRPASVFDDRLTDWRSALESSEAIQYMLWMREQSILRGVIGGQEVLVEVPQKFLAYTLSLPEIWARSYAQFVAKKSRDPVLLKQLEAARQAIPRRLYLPLQWEDEDFGDISNSIESLFRDLKWMK